MDTQFQKKFFCLFSDPFQLMDRRQFIHTIILLPYYLISGHFRTKEITGKTNACYSLL